MSLDRDCSEVRAGERAFEKGKKVNECPYAISNPRRTAWMTGWYDERTKLRLGKIFERNGISWP